MKEQGRFADIISYYVAADSAYRNWSEVPDESVPYSFHCGFHPEGKQIDQYTSIRLMTKTIIDASEIKDGQTGLDAGFVVKSQEDLTQNVLPSVKRLGTHAKKRLFEQPDASPIITESRHACVGLLQLVEEDKLKYILATFQKSKS